MADVEHGTAVEGGRPGISRRDALKKGAIAGGAVLWVSPIVQNIGISKAFANHVSPVAGGHGVSFVAFRFTCGGTTYFVKIENFTTGDPDGTCVGLNQGENCGVSQVDAISGCGLGLFTVHTTFNTGGEAVLVVVTLTDACANGSFDALQTKCGNGVGGCHAGVITSGGKTAEFSCPD